MKKNDIKNIADKFIFDRRLFKILMIIAVMLTAVPYLHTLIGGYIKIILLYGFLIVGYELVTGKFKTALRDKTGWLLIGFCVSYAVTVLINLSGNFTGDIKNLAYSAVFFALFFMFTEDNTKEDILKEIKLISTVVIVCTFLMSFASFIMYMFSFSGSYLNNEGVAVFFGMFENRLWGLYNPNTGSTLNCISIIISSIFIVDTNSRKTRVLNIINVVLQYMVLLLTGSRAAYYAVLIILALLVVFAALQKMKTVSFLSISKSLVSVVAVVCIFVFGGNILKAGLSYLPGITSNVLYNISTITGSSENQEPPVFEKTELDRIEEVENLDVGFFNGRTEIWGACLKEFAKSPVFGIGKENVIERSIDNLDDDKWKNHFRQGGTHNIYVCLLVSSGVVGFLIIGAFAVIILLKSFKVIVKKYNKINYWFLGATLLCIMFFVTEFVEARILFQVSTFSVIFWIYCGYMYKLAKFEDENNE